MDISVHLFYTNKSILKDPLEFWRTPRSRSAKHWQSSMESGRAKEQCNPSLVENCNAWIIYMSNERPQSLESEPSNRINCKTMEDNLSVKVGEIPRCHLIFIFIHYHSSSFIIINNNNKNMRFCFVQLSTSSWHLQILGLKKQWSRHLHKVSVSHHAPSEGTIHVMVISFSGIQNHKVRSISS